MSEKSVPICCPVCSAQIPGGLKRELRTGDGGQSDRSVTVDGAFTRSRELS